LRRSPQKQQHLNIKPPCRACEQEATVSRYIRVKQLEQDYGIDRVTVWRWGRNPKKRFPRAIRLSSRISVYDAEAIEQWIENQGVANDQRAQRNGRI
jgi:predicted DNA-binding transcriptional regulator AlpA